MGSSQRSAHHATSTSVNCPILMATILHSCKLPMAGLRFTDPIANFSLFTFRAPQGVFVTGLAVVLPFRGRTTRLSLSRLFKDYCSTILTNQLNLLCWLGRETPPSRDFRTIVSFPLPGTHQAARPRRRCGSLLHFISNINRLPPFACDNLKACSRLVTVCPPGKVSGTHRPVRTWEGIREYRIRGCHHPLAYRQRISPLTARPTTSLSSHGTEAPQFFLD